MKLRPPQPEPQQIVGLEAFKIFLSLMRPVNGSHEIWIKLGHNKFFVGDFDTAGQFAIASTKLKDPGDSRSRKKKKMIANAYDYIARWCRKNNGGAFFIPSQPIGLPLKANVLISDDIAAELDNGTAEEQWQKIWEFVEISGLNPSYIVHSGGKSYHPHWKLEQHSEIDRVTRLKKLLAIALFSDPAVVNAHQPMRLPGFFRKEKEQYQALSYHSETRLTLDEFETGLARFYQHKGWTYPEVLSGERWRLCRRLINWGDTVSDRQYKELVDRGYELPKVLEEKTHTVNTKTLVLAEPISENVKNRELERCLALPEHNLKTTRFSNNICNEVLRAKEKITLPNFYTYRFKSTNPWVSFYLNELLPRLHSLEQAFSLYDHQFVRRSSNRLDGDPGYRSTSGSKSFSVTWYKGEPIFRDWKLQESGDIVKYYWFCQGNTGYPRGKDYINVIKAIARDLNVPIPEELEKPFKATEPVEIKEPNNEEYEAYERELETDELAAEIEDLIRRERWFDETEIRNKNKYKKLKKYTANKTITDKFIKNVPTPVLREIYGLRSHLGSGKTQWLTNILNTAFADDGIIILGYRNSLLTQTKARLNSKAEEILGDPHRFKHLHFDDAAWDILGQVKGCLLLCPDSLPRLELEFFDGKVLVLDEINSVIRHILKGQTNVKRNRKAILELFRELVRRCKCIIALDGMLADWSIDYLKVLAGDTKTKVTKILNKYKPNPLKFINLIGEINENGDLTKQNSRAFHLQVMKDSDRPFIVSDSQTYCESLERMLIAEGKRGLRVDSITNVIPPAAPGEPPSIGDLVREFLKDPDAWIEKYKPEYLLISPIGESGLDISIKEYFDREFCFFFHLHTDAAKQMINRLRDLAPVRYLWCRESTSNNTSEGLQGYTPQQVRKNRTDFLMLDLKTAVVEGDSDRILEIAEEIALNGSDDPHLDTLDIIDLIDSYEKAHLRQCLSDMLRADGNEVEDLAIDAPTAAALQGIKQDEKDAIDETKDIQSNDIFESPDIDQQQADRISNNFNATVEERNSLKKFAIKKRLPGIDRTDSWNPEFIRYINFDNRRYIKQVELWWLLNNPEVAKKLQATKWENLLFDEVRNIKDFWIWDLRSNCARIEGLTRLGVLSLINSGIELSNESPELIEIVDRCREDRELQLLLGRKPKVGVHPLNWFKSLLNMIGRKLQKNRETKVNGEKKRFYVVAPILDALWTNIFGCVGVKWGEWRSNLSKPHPNFKRVIEAAEENKPSTANSPASTAKNAQTNSSSELDAVALRGCSIYTDHEVPPLEIINKNNSIESAVAGDRQVDNDFEITTKNAQTESSNELDAVALRGCSIYKDPQVPPLEIVNKNDSIESTVVSDRGANNNLEILAKNAQTDSSTELDEVALRGCSIYSDQEVPPLEIINSDDLVASLLDRSEELISLEIPTDEEPQPGNRVYSPITEQKGILQSFCGSYSSVIWDGTKTARSIYSHVIQKLEKVEVDRLKLVDAVRSLRNVLSNSKVIQSIKQLPETIVRAAVQWFRFEAKGLSTALEQVIKRIDYELYVELWS